MSTKMLLAIIIFKTIICLQYNTFDFNAYVMYCKKRLNFKCHQSSRLILLDIVNDDSLTRPKIRVNNNGGTDEGAACDSAKFPAPISCVVMLHNVACEFRCSECAGHNLSTRGSSYYIRDLLLVCLFFLFLDLHFYCLH